MRKEQMIWLKNAVKNQKKSKKRIKFKEITYKKKKF